jgi:hypothetical protein
MEGLLLPAYYHEAPLMSARSYHSDGEHLSPCGRRSLPKSLTIEPGKPAKMRESVFGRDASDRTCSSRELQVPPRCRETKTYTVVTWRNSHERAEVLTQCAFPNTNRSCEFSHRNIAVKIDPHISDCLGNIAWDRFRIHWRRHSEIQLM